MFLLFFFCFFCCKYFVKKNHTPQAPAARIDIYHYSFSEINLPQPWLEARLSSPFSSSFLRSHMLVFRLTSRQRKSLISIRQVHYRNLTPRRRYSSLARNPRMNEPPSSSWSLKPPKQNRLASTPTPRVSKPPKIFWYLKKKH